MKFHKHVFPSIEQYLHHRPPYLLVDELVEHSETEIVTRKRVTGDEFFLAGHFPGSPIFPGAMLQELTTQSAGILIAAEYNPMSVYDTTDPFFNEYALGVLVRVEQARYRSFARPGDQLEVRVVLAERVEQLFDFRATVARVGGPVIMRNAFQLTNIKSTLLQGTETAAGSN
jgi:3-hydroxyacyl-[acyl-carrier-protein] dehydratase